MIPSTISFTDLIDILDGEVLLSNWEPMLENKGVNYDYDQRRERNFSLFNNVFSGIRLEDKIETMFPDANVQERLSNLPFGRHVDIFGTPNYFSLKLIELSDGNANQGDIKSLLEKAINLGYETAVITENLHVREPEEELIHSMASFCRMFPDTALARSNLLRWCNQRKISERELNLSEICAVDGGLKPEDYVSSLLKRFSELNAKDLYCGLYFVNMVFDKDVESKIRDIEGSFERWKNILNQPQQAVYDKVIPDLRDKLAQWLKRHYSAFENYDTEKIKQQVPGIKNSYKRNLESLLTFVNGLPELMRGHPEMDWSILIHLTNAIFCLESPSSDIPVQNYFADFKRFKDFILRVGCSLSALKETIDSNSKPKYEYEKLMEEIGKVNGEIRYNTQFFENVKRLVTKGDCKNEEDIVECAKYFLDGEIHLTSFLKLGYTSKNFRASRNGNGGLVVKIIFREPIIPTPNQKRRFLGGYEQVYNSNSDNYIHLAGLLPGHLIMQQSQGQICTKDYCWISYLDAGPTLEEFLSDSPDICKGIPFIKQYFGSLVNSFKILHNQGWAHRDAKPGNLYIRKDENEQYQAVIGDLDTAILISEIRSNREENPAIESIGSPVYLSPQAAFEYAFLTSKPEDYKIPADFQRVDWQKEDVFFIGGMIYEAVTGQLPLQDVFGDNKKEYAQAKLKKLSTEEGLREVESQYDSFIEHLEGSLPPDIHDNPLLIHLLKRSLHPHQDKRADINELRDLMKGI